MLLQLAVAAPVEDDVVDRMVLADKSFVFVPSWLPTKEVEGHRRDIDEKESSILLS